MKQTCFDQEHSNISITFDTYSHALSGAGKTTARRFDKFLKPWLDVSEDAGTLLKKVGEPNTRLEGFEPTTLGSEDRCSIH